MLSSGSAVELRATVTTWLAFCLQTSVKDYNMREVFSLMMSWW